MVKRGEVWLVNLDPTVGSEIRKSRPCVVISPPELHDHLRTVIVAPMTSNGFEAPFRVALTFKGTSGQILLDQLRTVDKSRLAKHLGTVPSDVLDHTLQILRELFEAYLAQPGEMRAEFAARTDRHRAVADYIAGMTDRFALREHERLTGTRLL
mgnify:CR=1 FL=1